MSDETSYEEESILPSYSTKTLFNYELSPKTEVVVNSLVPAFSSLFLYVFLIGTDIAVIKSHHKDEDPTWASITLFFLYFPSLASFYLTISDLNLWPDPQEWNWKNIKWLVLKLLCHAFFPVWMMWRYAERVFWSIECLQAKTEQEHKELRDKVNSARTIELYIFLQAFLHSLPQIMLQFYILLRHKSTINAETKYAQIASMFLNLAKLSVTTTDYQRFKAQKVLGKNYPWYKARKKANPQEETPVKIRRKKEKSPKPLRRNSSDLYMQPVFANFRQSFTERLETLFRNSNNSNYTSTSIPDYNITRINKTKFKGLPEDDLGGKTLAFVWWFTYLTARIITISIFAYFYLNPCVYLLLGHALFVITCLLYDVKKEHIKQSKVMFFLFIGFVYIFCIVEFKIKFRKATVIYYGYFILCYIENVVMCLVWYGEDLEVLQNDYWFRFMFMIIFGALISSFFAMLLYFLIGKPKNVTFTK